MSFLDPQNLTQRTSVKRKRSFLGSASDDFFPSSLPSHLPSDSINPLSHSPGTLLQFSVAGLAETDANPSLLVPDFPHRGLGRGAAARRNVESDSEEERDRTKEEQKKNSQRQTEKLSRGPLFEALLQSVHQFLDRGEVDRAARAYGLLLQMQPHGVPVDVRHHNLWGIGAEIIMRQGEQGEATDGNDEGPRVQKRWGSAANMNRLKAYFETLIQQHPWDHRYPRRTCALDYWLALLNCEIYNVHAEHVMALSRLEDEAEDWDDDTDPIMDESYGFEEDREEAGSDARETKAKQRKEQLRLQALTSMKDITKRMDNLMQELPYSKNPEYLRLRAMAALYMGDLVVPLLNAAPLQLEQAQGQRQMEMQTARKMLRRVVDNGGELDPASRAILNPGDEDGDEEDSAVPLYPSLPIREL